MKSNLPGFSLGLAFLTSLLPAQSTTPSRPPNVVVLLADDQGWADLSANGNTNLRTPNIDSLARAGVTLDRFFVCPVCSPTRAEFLTGRYHPRTGVGGVDSGRERMNPDERTIADTFKAAGYATGVFGKWHNGGQGPFHPNARGFDEFYGFTAGHWGYYFDAPLEHNGQPVRGRGYIADDFTEHALTFIARNKASPFFCYVAFNTPHSPFCVPDEYWARWQSAPVALRAPEGGREDLATTRCVLAMTENLDWNVGRILRGLADLNLADDTIVIYFSDNGANTVRWNAGMKGKKGTTDEGGVRAPFFMRWPKRLPAGVTVAGIAGAIDLLPTLAHLANVPSIGSKPLDGMDLSPWLLGHAHAGAERRIFSHWAGRVSVRTQRYRLDDRGALFDLGSDPGQRSDLAAEQPAVAAELRAAVAAWRTEMFGAATATGGAPVATARDPRVANPDPRPIPVGFARQTHTVLPAGEGQTQGGVHRSNRFPNCTYFTHWTSREDSMVWELDVHEAGDFVVEIAYACPPADAGSIVELGFQDARLVGRITPAWDPPLLDQEDRVPRQESYMKKFSQIRLGSIPLARGRGRLTLRATEVAGAQVAEIFQVVLTRKPPAP